MATVRALIDGFVGTETGDARLRVDEEYDSSNPLVKAHPELFTPAEAEAKTAAPKKATRGGRP